MNECVLKLDALVFDEISFKRVGMKSEEKLELKLSVNVATNTMNPEEKRVSVRIGGEKKGEYSFDVGASGFFTYEGSAEDPVIQQNAAAIVMPYIRSEITLLTAQPGIEPIVLPPFNIAAMMSEGANVK